MIGEQTESTAVLAAATAEIEPRVPIANRTPQEVVLSNGAVALVRQVKGRDMVDAGMIARSYPVADEFVAVLALVAQVTTISGEQLLLSEVMEMPALDVNKLIEATQEDAAGKDVSSSAAVT